jgi:hypothetical protein
VLHRKEGEMQFKTLLEPYAEDGLRTVEGQIKWLQTKNLPKVYIDKAILFVYDELDRGKIFDNGHELDQYLLAKAKDLWDQEAKDSVTKLEDFFQQMKSKWKEDEDRLRKAHKGKVRRIIDTIKGNGR